LGRVYLEKYTKYDPETKKYNVERINLGTAGKTELTNDFIEWAIDTEKSHLFKVVLGKSRILILNLDEPS